jgi:hypothetical protein
MIFPCFTRLCRRIPDIVDKSKSAHAREHTHSSSVGEVGRDLRGCKGVCGDVPLKTTPAAVPAPRIVFSSHGFYGENHPRRPRLRGLSTTEKPGMKKTTRRSATTAGVVFSETGPQTPLSPRGSRPTSPAQGESVCSRACRDCEPRRVRLGGTSVGVGGCGRSGGPTVGPFETDTRRGPPVVPGWKVPARTGTYALIPRRRSRTRPPWSQGRLWACPAVNDTCRRTPAAYRFFLSWVLWEEPPAEAAAPRVVDP